MSKKIYKVQELVCGSKINACRIGRKSGRVLVTAGEDKKVTMWALGKPDQIMSFAQNTSAIDCVTFDATEQLVAAGSAGGTIKLWDLDQQKVVRSFNGHKSNCVSLEFHPFGEFFASGSIDTELKIWDLRRKGCIQTYRGHNKPINTIRFSPDGRWVVSGGQDGILKLWDLTAGKLIHDFKHDNSINTVEFHPHEFLLCSGGDDHSIKFWDLESFDAVSTAVVNNNNNNNNSNTNNNSNNNNNVVKRIQFSSDGSTVFAAYPDSLRMWSWEPSNCIDVINVPWKDVVDLYVTENQLVCTSITGNTSTIWMANPLKLMPPNISNNTSLFSSRDINNNNNNINTINSNNNTTNKTNNNNNNKNSTNNNNNNNNNNNSSSYSNYNPELNRTSEALKQIQNTTNKSKTSNLNNNSNPANNSVMSPINSNNNNNVGINKEKTPPPPTTTTTVNINDFISKDKIEQQRNSDEIIEEIMGTHGTMCNVLSLRLTNLRVIRNIWSRTDVKDAFETCLKLKDPAIEIDILNVLIEKPNIITLDICLLLLPAILDLLLISHYEDYLLTCLKLLILLINSFGSTIKTSIEGNINTIGVDLSRDERIDKCKSCNSQLILIRSKLDTLNLTSYSTQVTQYHKDALNLLKSFPS